MAALDDCNAPILVHEKEVLMSKFLAIVEVSSKDQTFSVTPFDATSNEEMLKIIDRSGMDISCFGAASDLSNEEIYGAMASFYMSWGESSDGDRYIIPISKLSEGYSLDEAKKSWTPENQEKAKKMLSEGKSRCEILKEFDTTIIVIGDYFWPNF